MALIAIAFALGLFMRSRISTESGTASRERWPRALGPNSSEKNAKTTAGVQANYACLTECKWVPNHVTIGRMTADSGMTVLKRDERGQSRWPPVKCHAREVSHDRPTPGNAQQDYLEVMMRNSGASWRSRTTPMMGLAALWPHSNAFNAHLALQARQGPFWTVLRLPVCLYSDLEGDRASNP